MENFITINDIKINYKTTGNGQDVLLLHGWGCSLEIWKTLQSQLEKKFKVTSIDFPGFGKSDEPKEIWGVEEYTRCTEQLIEKLGLKNPVLIGHSFGGRVSILLSSRNEYVEKVVLTDSAGIKPQNTKISVSRIFSKMKKISTKIVGEKITEKIVRPFANSLASEDYKNASGIMKEILKKVIDEDLQAEMPKIKAPTLLIWGEKDTATPLCDALIMEKLIPDAGVVIFPNCTHYSFLENPNYYFTVVDNFLSN
ncbi:MAG: alpha/beta hydrolase [Bacteroidales bacterium]|nr:alpha/beta hydrolase [Bacteroidales bacterium]